MIILQIDDRRKFRSQTSDNMDRWKAELGRGREKRRAEESRSEKWKSQKKEDADARKGRKVAKHCVFPMICGSGGSKSRIAKAAGAEPSGQMRDEKVHTVVARSTFVSEKAKNTSRSDHSWKLRCRKVHAVVVRSTFRSQNVQDTPMSDHFWKLRCRKSARRCGAKHISKSKCTIYHMLAPLLEVQMSFRVAGARDCAPCQKWAKTWGFCRSSKNHGRRGAFEEDLQRCIFCVRRSTKDMFMRDVRRSGRWFPERGCILEHQICRFAKMILRDRCSTSYDLASIFRGRRSTLDRWSGKIAKRIGTRLSALHLTFHFWRKSRRIALFLMLSSSKIEELSQNCFVLDVVKFKNCKRLVELFRFWCCQRRKIQEVS